MKKIYFLLLTVLFASVTNAQLTGVKTIPGTYATIAAAITDLNTQGVGAGGVVFNIAAGYTETAPSGGYVLGTTALNATLSAANTVVIQKNGAGANPLITAFTGGTSTTSDGIFKIAGADYVTIDGIDLVENASNSGAAFMEWGYALVNLNAASPFDGCQNVTIKNCSVTLDRSNPNGSFGIYSAHNIATNATALTITAAGDTHSNNKFYSNTISNVNEGFWILGFAAASPYTLYDQNNDVGGASLATGNTVKTMGVTALFNSFCIYLVNQNGASAMYNTIDNALGGASASSTQLIGVYAAGTNSNVSINSNNIKLTQSGGSSIVAPIYTTCNGTVNINNNTIQLLTTGATTGTNYGIALATTVAATLETVQNNIINASNISTTGTAYIIYASNATNNKTISGNVINGGFNKTGAGGTVYGYYNFGSPTGGTANINNNNFSGITVTGATTVYGIYQATATSQIELVNNNTVSNITGGTSTIFGIHHNYGAVGSVVSNNVVSNLTGAGTVTGIQLGNSTASLGLSVFNNEVSGLSTTGASTVSGIIHSTGANTSIYKNKVYNLQSNNAGGVTNGITIAAGTTVNVYNNLVGDLRAIATSSATDAVRGINLTSTTTSSNLNIFYNTVYLNASSSGTNFSTSGLFHTFSTTATTAALNLRNNIIVNNSVPKGTGFTSAFRRSASTNLNNYATTSNNNLFFAGGACANRLIYYDGTNADQTLAAFKTRVSTRETASVTEDPAFLSTSGASANFLHINPAVATQIESGAATIATYTDDYDGNTRGATPDIGADEFTGTIATACAGAPTAGVASTTSPICSGQSATICLTGQTAAAGISVQWQSSAVSGGPYTNIACAGGTCYNTGALTPGTYYYIAVVTCANGGATATSNQVTVVVNAPPTVAVNPPAPSICSAGTGVNLTASGASTYSWSPAAGLSSTTGATVTANPATTTTYTVTGTDGAGCTNTATVTVTVNNSPTITSVSASSNSICIGSSINLFSSATSNLPPTTILSEGFESVAGIPAGWVSVNTGTGNLWAVPQTNGAARTGARAAEYNWNTTQAATAYLITPGLSLTGGVTYTISSWYRNSGTTFPEKLRVTVGNAQTAAAQTTVVQNVGTVTSTTYLQQSATFTPASSGTYYFAWNAYSDPDQFYLDVDDILITAPSGPPSYSWTSTPAGYTSSLQNPTGVTPTVTTTYTVTATNAVSGCSVSSGTTVTVSDNTAAISYTPSAVCKSAAPITVTRTGAAGGTYTASPAGLTIDPSTGTITPATSAPNTYTITYTNPAVGACPLFATTATVTINALPTAYNVTGGGPYCAGGVGVPVGLSNSETGVNYQLVLNGVTNVGAPVPGTTGLPISFGNQLTAGVYTVVATNATTSCTANMSGSVTISINPVPVIGSTQVEPTTCVSADGSITLTMSGAAGPYTFVWTGSGVNPTSQNQTGLTVGAYSVTATAANGCTATANFALSGPGGCSVCPTIPTFATNPSGAACAGSNVSFTASGLTNMGITYGIIFKYSASPLANPYVGGTVIATVANGALTSGGTVATANSATIPAGNYTVYAILTPTPIDPACRPAGQAALTIGTTPDVNQPASQTVCNNTATAAVNFTGSVPGTTFNWTNNTTSIGLAASGTGNIASFTGTNATNAAVTATITVTPQITSSASPVNQTFAYTGSLQSFIVPAGVTSIDVTANGAQGGGGGGLGASIKGTVAVTPGETISVLVGGTGGSYSNGNGGGGGGSFVWKNTGNVLLVAAGGGGGTSNNSNASVGGPGSATNTPTNSINGSGNTAGGSGGNGGSGGAGTLNGESYPAGGGGGAGWLSNGGNGLFTYGATGGLTPLNGGNGGTGFNPCGSVNIPGGFGGGGGAGGCSGASGGGGGYNGGGGGNNWSGSTWGSGGGGGSFNLGSAQVNNAGVQSGNGQVILTYLTSITCSGTPKTFTITVNPTPVVNAVTSQTVCNGALTAPVNFTSPTTGPTGAVSFTWTNSNTAIGLGASGTGNIPAFTGTNATAAPISGTITVTPVYTGGSVTCTGTPITFTITINPTPTVNAQANQVVCVGTVTTATFSGAVAGTVYNWTNSNTAIGLGASGTGNISFTSTNATTAPIVGTITVTPSYTNGGTTCTGTPRTFTITVNPTPTVNQPANQSLCPGVLTAPVVFTGTVPGTVFNWTNSNTTIGLGASGTGNIPAFTALNPGSTPNVGTITVTPSYTNGAVTCTGTPRTFTITVTPNPPLVIVADPGTTICEGDPTLLTVRDQTGAAAAPVPEILYYKFDGTGNTVPNLASAPPPGSATGTIIGNQTQGGTGQCGTALIGAGGAANANNMNTGWNTNFTGPFTMSFWLGANQVDNNPSYLFGNSSAASVFRGFYGGAALTNNMLLRGGSGDILITGVNPAATLVTVVYNGTSTDVYKNGVFFQNYAVTFNTSAAAPFLVGGYNSASLSMTGSLDEFRLYNRALTAGEVGQLTNCASAGAGPISTGTFLWTPAAGLSSTTTNPVAASPQNTTTYTVTRTTVPGGCTASANITITVNKRPVVTTQPAATVVCEGSNATYTVGATGTGLTYQWQESLTGCPGTWTNLANGGLYSGVTTTTLTVGPVTNAMNGRAYRCVVSGVCAPWTPPTNVSSCALLTVNPNPIVTVTPASGCGGVAGINGLLLTASGANSYTWAPVAGLYTNATATNAYTGTNTATVYAAPTTFTAYTVTGTLTATGCSNTATAFINYTPPAPTVTPSSVTMCLGDPAVRLVSSSSTSSTITASSGAISVIVPDGTGAPATSSLTVAGVPAASTLSEIKVTLNMSHTWVGDMDINLVAPNNQILNLVGGLNGGTGSNGTANFTNTAFSSLGGATISGFAAPRTGTFAAEARAGYGPTGFIQTVTNWNGLAANAAATNGTWRLAMGDWGGGDVGTLTSWSIGVTYVVGVPSTPATWSPIAGLFNDAAATIPYTGTPRDTVWTRPTPSGVYTYQATVQSLPAAPLAFANPAPITINAAGNATPYPSNVVVSGLPTSGVSVKSVSINGLSHTWSDDVDILLQSPSGQNVILMSDIGNAGVFSGNNYTFDDAAAAMPATAAAPPSGTYKPTNFVGLIGPEPDNWPAPGPGAVAQPNPTLSSFTGNMNGTWKLFVFDDAAGDGGSIAGGFSVNFNLGILPCTSPARTVVVTVNQPVALNNALPVNQTICTDKVATFTVAVASGTGPFSYQWQVSTNGNNPPWTNIANGGVYSGATTATLTITAPPVSMSGYFYRCIVTGAAPCASATSFAARLTVNPLPTVVISAAPYTSLFPGLRTTLSSTVSPAAASTYTWLRNGVAVSGATTGTLNVDVDGLGDYQLRVTDVNGCTNSSNIVTIKDSASGRCFIYPNPNSGQFQVRYYSVANNVLPRGIVVYDAKGDRVMTQNYTVGRPYDRMDVDMRRFGKGLYWVEIVDRNGNRITMCRVAIQ